MSETVATVAIDIVANDHASRQMVSIERKAQNVGKTFGATELASTAAFTAVSAGALAATGAVTAFGASAVKTFLDIDKSYANIAAVTGNTAKQMEAVDKGIRAVALSLNSDMSDSASAFYDIASAVADASTHMAILEESTKLAQAGQANLAVTTDGLINIMNSYSLSADKAAMVSDIYAQTVAKGKGTMDQFVAALAPLGGIGKELGLQFEDLGASVAFMTTKGVSANKAGTQLEGVMKALIKPTEEMKAGLKAIGVETGEAAIEQYGLVATIQMLKGELSSEMFGKAFGNIEGFRGALALAGDDAGKFFEVYKSGMDGAVGRARAQQMDTVTYQLERIGNQLELAGQNAIAFAEQFQFAGVGILDMLSAVGDGLALLNFFLSPDLTVGEPNITKYDMSDIDANDILENATVLEIPQEASITYTVERGDTVNEIAAELGLDEAGRQKLIDQLEAAGYTTTTMPVGFEFEIQGGLSEQLSEDARRLTAYSRGIGTASEHTQRFSQNYSDAATKGAIFGTTLDLVASKLGMDIDTDGAGLFVTLKALVDTIGELSESGTLFDVFKDNFIDSILDLALQVAQAVDLIASPVDALIGIYNEIAGKDVGTIGNMEASIQAVIDYREALEEADRAEARRQAARAEMFRPVEYPREAIYPMPQLDPMAQYVANYGQYSFGPFDSLPTERETWFPGVLAGQSQQTFYASNAMADMNFGFGEGGKPIDVTANLIDAATGENFADSIMNTFANQSASVDIETTPPLDEVEAQMENIARDEAKNYAIRVTISRGFSPTGSVQIEERASGGNVNAGQPYLIGERGPELFIPSGAGNITPNHRLGSGGNVTVIANAPIFGSDQLNQVVNKANALR